MGLNKVDDYFRKDTELQNYTKTGVKGIINSFIFQNNFQFLPVHFLYFEKNVLRVSFEMLALNSGRYDGFLFYVII